MFLPLVSAGLMPNLAALMRRGCHGPLTPVLSDCAPACWATLVTGLWPDRHGVLAAAQEDDADGGVQPVDSASLAVPAVWDYLAAAGIEQFRVGLPLSHPARGPGKVVSGAYPGKYREGGRWRDMDDALLYGFDADDTDLANELRVHPESLDAGALGPLIPALASIDPRSDRRPAFVAVALARSFSLHNAATWLLEEQNTAVAFIRYPLLADLARGFLAYHPPRLAAISEADFALYRGVVSGACRVFDLLLGRIVELAGAQARVLVASTHGFQMEAQCRAAGLGVKGRPAPELRPEGWWLFAGDGAAAEPRRATVLDIAPTLLAACGLAPPPHWPGVSLMPERAPLLPAPHPAMPLHPADPEPARGQVAAWTAQLAEMGLTDPLAPHFAERRRQLAAERAWNRYRIHMQRAEIEPALQCLQALSGGPRALMAALEMAGIFGALARWQDAARILAPIARLFVDGGVAQLADAGLPVHRVPVASYRHGIEAILARAKSDFALARLHLELLGQLTLPIPCIDLLRQELGMPGAPAGRGAKSPDATAPMRAGRA
ncbi:MAG: alkaline phosphatase family protein [Rhodocyclaceae bacterium]|nr:alkaline phosphatase family protein [Rhodocyclaceae bacterium]